MKKKDFHLPVRLLFTILSFLATSGLEAQSDMRDSLILEYMFESDDLVRVLDSSSSGQHGTLMGGISRTNGYRGNGIEFNDLDAHILVGDSADILDLQVFTFMGWLNPFSRGSDDKRMEILEKTNSYWFNIRKETGLLRVGCFFVPRGENNNERWYYMDGDTPIALNSWAHVTFTYDGTTMHSYVNGRLVNRYRVDLDVRETDYTCSIGSRQPRNEGGDTLPAAFFHGLMDEFRIFRRALTQEEILTMMSSNNPTAVPPAIPTNLSVQALEPGKLTLSWDDNSEFEDEFWIYSSPDNIAWELAGWTLRDTTQYHVTDASPGSIRYYRICAANLSGRSPYTGSVQAEIPQELLPQPESVYSFEGNLKDTFGSRHGLSNENITYQEGVDGQAIEFNGENSYASIPYNLLNDFTVTMWIKATLPGFSHNTRDWFRGSGLLDGNVGGYCGEFGISLFGQHAAFGTGGGNSHTSIIGTTPLVDDSWHHLAATFESETGNMWLYIDGIEEVSTTGGKIDPKNAAGRLALGSLQRDENYFSGRIDELRLYQSCLTQSQIHEIIARDTASVATNVQPSGDLHLHLYPNPASDYLYLSTPHSIHVSVYTMTGQEVKSSIIYPGIPLDISGIPSGVYILRAGDPGNRMWVAKFVKK